MLHTRAVLQLGVLLLLCSPTLLFASSVTGELDDAWQVSQSETVLATALWEHVQQQAEGETGDDRGEPPAFPDRTGATPIAGASGLLVIFSDDCEQLPNPPEYLQALLRAPPIA